MSKSRKRGLQRWQVRFRTSMRRLKRLRELRKLGYLPPVKLVRFDDVMRDIYPKDIR